MSTHLRPRALALAVLFAAAPAFAAQPSVIDQLRDACGDEVRDLCANVTPGDGRVIACLYANEDQVSPRCNFVLYESAPELGNLIAAMTQMANACRADIQALCADFERGGGGIGHCLQLHRAQVTPECANAIIDTGVQTKNPPGGTR